MTRDKRKCTVVSVEPEHLTMCPRYADLCITISSLQHTHTYFNYETNYVIHYKDIILVHDGQPKSYRTAKYPMTIWK